MSTGIRARAPLRISFGGGGTDVSPYCDDHGGSVINTTVNRYAYATVYPSDKIKVRAIDYDQDIEYEYNEDFAYGNKTDLALGIIDHFRNNGYLETGVEVVVHADSPPGSGLGTSSTIAVALIAALLKYCNKPIDKHELASKAYQIERVELGQSGGRQDQYTAAFGGFNFMEFCEKKTQVHPLPINKDVLKELHYRMVFAYAGGMRHSYDIIKEQQDNYRTVENVVEAYHYLKEISVKMRDALLVGEIDDFSLLCNDAWHAKKKLASGITSSRIDSIYDAAISAGAKGGKLSGAGGGGFMFFLCEPEKRSEVQRVLKEKDCPLVDMNFETEGVTTWAVGCNKTNS